MDVATAFALLQVTPSDDSESARRAYRRLALELHPDKNPSATAAEEFAVLQEAHEVVQAHLSSGKRPSVVEVSPRDACRGVPLQRVDVDVSVMCKACGGVGAPNPRNVYQCIECSGAGCSACAGIGRRPKKGCACRTCRGTGRVPEKRRVEVAVPVGVRDGDELAPGVVCRHTAYDGWRWRIGGTDLLVELDVTLREALCGLSRTIETCRGPQTVSVDAPVDLWCPLTLRGHGLRGEGDAVVTFRITGWGCSSDRLRLFGPALRKVFGPTEDDTT